MHVDVREMPLPVSLTDPDKERIFFAIVVTLASIALLSFSLRVYTHGKLLRFFAIDDGLALVAALCIIGVLITFACLVQLGFGKDSWETSSNNSSKVAPWVWASTLLHIVGIGFVKLSAVFFLLRVFHRRYCRYILYGLGVLLALSTLVWFGSVLLQCVPVAAAWTTSPHSKPRCMSQSTYMILSLVNNTINTGTDLVLVVLAIHIACGHSLNLANRVFLAAVLCAGFTACAAAIVRIWMLFRFWGDQGNDSIYDLSFTAWSIIELTTALTAINLPTLRALAKALHALLHKRRHPTITTPHPSTYHSPHHSHSSSRTVIYRPNTTYFPSTRFHDDISNLDFDIETPATRTRTTTMRSRVTHSRNASDWSQFSGFTYYTDPTEPPELEGSRSQENLTELEVLVKGLGLGRRGSRGMSAGGSGVTVVGEDTVTREGGGAARTDESEVHRKP